MPISQLPPGFREEDFDTKLGRNKIILYINDLHGTVWALLKEVRRIAKEIKE